jgi:hypothetical protein
MRANRFNDALLGSASGERLPGALANAMRQASRSNVFGSMSAAEFITDGRDVTWL